MYKKILWDMWQGISQVSFISITKKSTELCKVIVDIHLITIIYPLLLQTYHYALVGTLQVDKWIFELCLSLV